MNYGHQNNFLIFFFDKSLYKHIAEQTNLYSLQVTGKPIKTDENEIQQFIGILILMGILKYLQYRMYWSQFMRCSSISEIMSVKRFETIKRFFHVSDSNEIPKKGEPGFDLLYKVRHIVNFLLENSQKIQQEKCKSIDKQIIPTKSRAPIRQYCPMKPHKWGIKMWARCGVSGILYDFDVYLGKQPGTDTCKKYVKVGAVLLKFVESLPKNIGYKVYMDNLFLEFQFI